MRALSGAILVERLAHSLLRREPARFDHARAGRLIAGKRVMVTGAGGSIGAELTRQALRHAPARLVLVDRAEAALFAIDADITRSVGDARHTALVADVSDEARMRQIFRAERPQIVLHAAAHKHVALMEHNPAEAIKNNVLATWRLGALAAAYGVETFVLVSTDKAVGAASVMGASKRVAELVMHYLHRRVPAGRYLAVRFGNVIGSAGSVVPLFRVQIARGGPVTVTHPDVTRYFMTIEEAAKLVLEAAAAERCSFSTWASP
jgi:FlaA1/EpsC-like NDP-sugar epimerase